MSSYDAVTSRPKQSHQNAMSWLEGVWLWSDNSLFTKPHLQPAPSQRHIHPPQSITSTSHFNTHLNTSNLLYNL